MFYISYWKEKNIEFTTKEYMNDTYNRISTIIPYKQKVNYFKENYNIKQN